MSKLTDIYLFLSLVLMYGPFDSSTSLCVCYYLSQSYMWYTDRFGKNTGHVRTWAMRFPQGWDDFSSKVCIAKQNCNKYKYNKITYSVKI